MKVIPKDLASKIISSPRADVEVHSHESQTGIWDILAILCDKGVLASLTRLESPFRSINCMQLPGYGKSTFKGSVESATLDDHLAAMDSVLSSKQTLLYGYSHGGFFTAQYAIKHADKVQALVLVEPALFTASEDLLERAALLDAGKDVESMARMVQRYDTPAAQSEAQVTQVAEQLVKNVNSGSTVAQEFRIRAANAVTEADLAALDMPVLLIGGTRSHASHMVKRAFQAIPHATVSWIEGASHLDLEKPEFAPQIARAIDAFLSSIGATGTPTYQSLMTELFHAAKPAAQVGQEQAVRA
ncbi:alpha/beta fold hydrolase [Roseateles amylovorans]|uniref:Alpha/beta hydrolase n=1 Tax=Roseateles amylovorans TaxID=2978473 RepID=A0ABY6ASA6_9BURK|nr:alpha/beta hydrolase [Roseateles amylovorans]UXH76111.1 alpha/beta hydrolase [Roseateles amylovorans]